MSHTSAPGGIPPSIPHHQPPSRILRRLLREALTGGPDYFKDELVDLRRMCRELSAIGRNLNQLVRTANQGGAVDGADVRRVINAGLMQMEAVKELYGRAVRATVKRAVLPLSEVAGLPVTRGVGGQGQERAEWPE